MMKVKLLIASVVLSVSTVGFAREVVSTFNTEKGKVEIYVGSGNAVYIATSVNNWSTGFEKGGSSNCEFKKGGSCYSESSMVGEVESKTRSGAYWR